LHSLVATLIAILLAGATAFVATPSGAQMSGPPAAAPGVTGPVPGSPSLISTSFDLATVGYEQSEFFLSGSASAYSPQGPLTADGRWRVAPSSTAPYATRMVVNRPSDPAEFNGTVIVEWLNVSGGLDAAPIWTLAHTELLRSGYVWIGLSAQAVGLDATKRVNPERYGTLNHPGDSYSYDMFSQAGQAVREQADLVLGGLEPQQILGSGESQSAIRLVTYLNAVHPLAGAYDGYLVHTGFGRGAPLSQAPLPDITVPAPTKLRTDLDVRVLQFETETELASGFLAARQPDTRNLRTWELAGAAHYDYYGLGLGFTDDGDGEAEIAMLNAQRNPTRSAASGFITCELPINSGPQTYVLRAAIHALNEWVSTGRPPAHSRELRTTSDSPVTFALDRWGNVRGGIRTPFVDAPLAALRGVGQPPGGSFCGLFGTTTPLTDEQLDRLYPSEERFVRSWKVKLRRAVAQGFILPADARLLETAFAGFDPGL
jgi:Alpha/beta hydrolase domain